MDFSSLPLPALRSIVLQLGPLEWPFLREVSLYGIAVKFTKHLMYDLHSEGLSQAVTRNYECMPHRTPLVDLHLLRMNR